MTSSSSSSSSSPSETKIELQFKSSKMITQCLSYHGVPIDQLSSAIQKAGARRGDADTAISLAREWLLFGEWRAQPERASMALSNFFNRIFRVAVVEDILAFTEIPKILKVHKTVSAIFETYKTAIKTPKQGGNDFFSEEWVNRLAPVLSSLEILTACRKYRIGSEMKLACLGTGSSKIVLPSIKDLKQVSEFKRNVYRLLGVTDAKHLISELAFVPGGYSLPTEVKSNSLDKVMGISDIGDKDEVNSLRRTWQLVFVMFSMLPEFEKGETPEQRSVKEAARANIRAWRKVFWGLTQDVTLLLKSQSGCEIIRDFYEYCYKSFKDCEQTRESFLFPVHLLLACIHRKCVPLLDEFHWKLQVTARSAHVRLLTLEPPPKPCAIPAYAIDMHTKEGRNKGMGRKEFGLEGSVVIPMDMEYCDPEVHDNYVKFKVSQGSGKVKSKATPMDLSSSEQSDEANKEHVETKRKNKRKNAELDADSKKQLKVSLSLSGW